MRVNNIDASMRVNMGEKGAITRKVGQFLKKSNGQGLYDGTSGEAILGSPNPDNTVRSLFISKEVADAFKRFLKEHAVKK